MTENNQQLLTTKRIFVKDFSFEAPGGVQTFTNPWKPETNVDVDVTKEKITDDLYEVVLSLIVVVKNAGSTAFMIEVFQGGIFECVGFSDAELHRVLHTVCPTLLFPYAAEAIDGMALKASFPALVMQPINFDRLYRENKAEAETEEALTN